MQRLYGRVLTKESNIGIPDLVVAVFDLDPSSLDLAALSDASSPLSLELSRALFGQLQNRLGSVLTDSSGNFDLPITKETAQHYGSNRVPDLVLAVFAPEDSAGVENPMPAPPQERLLFLSRSARSNAGPTEAYIIRIHQAQLDAFAIPVSQAGGITDITEFATAIGRTRILHQQLRSHIAADVQHAVDARAAAAAKARTVFQNLSLPPSSPTGGAYHVGDNNDVVEIAATHLAAMSDGMARLTQYQPQVRLLLSADDLAALNLQTDDAGAVVGQVSAVAMAERMLAMSGGPDLIRAYSATDKRRSVDDYLARAGFPTPTSGSSGHSEEQQSS